MVYEHERWIKHLIELRLITEGYNPNEETKAVEELREVYAKAKVFDEVIKKVETEFVSEDLADSIRILVNDYEYDMEEK